MTASLYDIIDPDQNRWQERALAAERTVAVLKRTVRKLQNGDGADVVQQQIARMRAKQQQAREKRQLMEARQQVLEKHNAQLEATVAERTQSLRNILDNVTFGFLIVGPDLTVKEGFTASCQSLLDVQIHTGDHLADLLRIPKDRRWEIAMAMEQIFDDFLPEAVTLSQMPSRFVIGDRILRLEGRTLREGSEVTGLLLSISDTTALEAARRENQRNAVVIDILQRRSAFDAFIDDTAALLRNALDNLDDQAVVRRYVHTVKGNAGAFNLQSVSRACHEVEADVTIDAVDIERIEDSLRDFLISIRHIVHIDYAMAPAPSIPVDAHNLEVLYDTLRSLGAGRRDLEIARSMMLRPASEVVGPLEPLVQRLANQLNKQVDFHLEGLDVRIMPGRLRPVFRNLTHLVRNALDHGIELPEDRGDKPETAQLTVKIEDRGDEVCISVSDDGCGIDVDRVVQRAVDLGIIHPKRAAELDHDAQCALIFEDGLSVAEEATEISGRGVGMSAMKDAVESVGGYIDVHSEPGVGTTMWLHVPREG